MADKIKLRRDTQANWEAVNPILDEGELGVITDSNGLVIGDGVTCFTKLPQKRTFSENIDITVGPGGDFTDVNEALAYIQYLQPKFRTVTEVTRSPTGHGFDQFHLDLQINLIFKEGYVFTHPIVFENVYAPWLNITQENLNVPLEINIPYDSITDNTLIAIGMFQSHLRNITLNLQNTNLTDLLLTPLYMVNSTLNEVSLEVQDVQIGIYMSHNSVIKEIKHFVANKIKTYPLYLCYNCYAMIRIEPETNAFNINDVGTTHPSDPYSSSAICLTESKLIFYSRDLSLIHYIDTVTSVFTLRGLSQLFLRYATVFNINNVTEAIFRANGTASGSVSIYTPLRVGTNISEVYIPTDIVPNAYNKKMLISAMTDVTTPIDP